MILIVIVSRTVAPHGMWPDARTVTAHGHGPAATTPMQQLQMQQAQMQREQERLNEFWADIVHEMQEIDPEKVGPRLADCTPIDDRCLMEIAHPRLVIGTCLSRHPFPPHAHMPYRVFRPVPHGEVVLRAARLTFVRYIPIGDS